jgi:hypothetical protein
MLKAILELPDYNPTDPACSKEALIAQEAALTAAEEAAKEAQLAYQLARVMHVEAQRAVNDAIRGMKAQLRTLPADDPQALHLAKWIRKLERDRSKLKVQAA